MIVRLRALLPAAALAAVLALTEAASAQAQPRSRDCRYPAWYIPPGGEAVIAARVRPGGVCVFANTSTSYGRGVSITQRPRHGMLGAANEKLVAYRSHPAATGSDSFEFVFETVDRVGRPLRNRARVNVTFVDAF